MHTISIAAPKDSMLGLKGGDGLRQPLWWPAKNLILCEYHDTSSIVRGTTTHEHEYEKIIQDGQSNTRHGVRANFVDSTGTSPKELSPRTQFLVFPSSCRPRSKIQKIDHLQRPNPRCQVDRSRLRQPQEAGFTDKTLRKSFLSRGAQQYPLKMARTWSVKALCGYLAGKNQYWIVTGRVVRNTKWNGNIPTQQQDTRSERKTFGPIRCKGFQIQRSCKSRASRESYHGCLRRARSTPLCTIRCYGQGELDCLGNALETLYTWFSFLKHMTCLLGKSFTTVILQDRAFKTLICAFNSTQKEWRRNTAIEITFRIIFHLMRFLCLGSWPVVVSMSMSHLNCESAYHHERHSPLELNSQQTMRLYGVSEAVVSTFSLFFFPSYVWVRVLLATNFHICTCVQELFLQGWNHFSSTNQIHPWCIHRDGFVYPQIVVFE